MKDDENENGGLTVMNNHGELWERMRMRENENERE